jgi:hypothetical protein
MKDIRKIHVGCLAEFPFLDYTFDSNTEWQILQKLGEKINEIVGFINDTLDAEINEYIDRRFNDLMINAMYEAETETLILYLTH